jgi:tetratricopeptide (TPR) repeat protein
MLFNQRRYREASVKFEQALQAMDALATADPKNLDDQKSLVESLAWAADSHFAEGRIERAISDRERDVALVKRLFKRTRDSEFGSKLIAAERSLATLYAAHGQIDLAITAGHDAETQAEQLLSVEPANSRWIERSAQSRLDMTRYFLAKGDLDQAAGQVSAGCSLADALYKKDPSVADWRAVRRDCLRMQATIALSRRDKSRALAFAEQAVTASKSVDSTDPIEDRYFIARSYRVLGDVEQSLGNENAARSAWTSGLAAIPSGLAERPSEMSAHAMLLKRLGQTAAADELASRLSTMGYQSPSARVQQTSEGG